MISRQLNFKLLHKLPNQRSPNLKTLHSFQNEHQLFDQSPRPVSSSISHSMLHQISKNRPHDALRIFKIQTRIASLENLDKETVTVALKACRGEPKLGRQIHGFSVSSGFLSHSSVTNSLMNMYSKSGKFVDALSVFKGLNSPCNVAWNTILSGFKNSDDALSFALRMNRTGTGFDPVSYTMILGFCSDYEEFISFGYQIHCHASKSGLDSELFVGNALISFYSRCETLSEAGKKFYEMSYRDLVSWNAILSGFSQEGNHGHEAIVIFIAMVRERLELDHISFTSAVSACGHLRNLTLGRQIHCLVMKSGYRTDLSISNVLISTYSKSEDLENAKLVFQEMEQKNAVSWTSMISIEEENAVSLFNEMRLNRSYPNDVTFIGLIHAVTTRDMVPQGKSIHGFCLKTGFLSELNVFNSLITMYAKFELMDKCLNFFEELNCRDITSWNSLITGYARNGLHRKALEMFVLAVNEFRPNHYTLGSTLSSIADSDDISLQFGQLLHTYLIKLGLNTHSILTGALLDMYAKRGSIFESRQVFDETPERTQFAWTGIISAYASHGDSDSTLNLFREMESVRVKPDSVTFLSVLTACSRNGMVETGREIFNSMVKKYRIEPSKEHYSCMVDLFGRSGRLDEAEEILTLIPGGPGLNVLLGLLGSCLTHRELEMGERMARAVIRSEPSNSGAYVAVSNLYAERGEWDEVASVRRMMRERKVKKAVGMSWVDVNGSMRLHGFSAGDMSHPRWRDIFKVVKFLELDMKSLSEIEIEVDHYLGSSK